MRWRFPAWVRMALPVADILNFLVAAFLVFILGMIVSLLGLPRIGGNRPKAVLCEKADKIAQSPGERQARRRAGPSKRGGAEGRGAGRPSGRAGLCYHRRKELDEGSPD